jgi:F-type H+-transporting ATPase subunit gamma
MKILLAIDTQQELFQTLESALADFQKFYGATFGRTLTELSLLYVLIGSERGFCGGFNEAVQKALGREALDSGPKLILVGRKLSLKFSDDKRVVSSPEGPSITKELEVIMLSVDDPSRGNREP